MNIPQKLQIIQQLSGLTQEKLAQSLGVSFPAFNSWFNAKSHPRKTKQQRIDDLYKQYTGQEKPAGDPLSVKKTIIQQKQQRFKNVLDVILKRRDIYEQFVLALTYNTNRIEGSTLTEPETAAILFQNVALSNKTLVEQLEAKNHQAALDFLFEYFLKDDIIDEKFILKLHGVLLNGIQQDAGRYRQHAVRIVGTNIPTANYLKVPQLMNELVGEIKKKKGDVLAHCAGIHSRFEQIHPFSDGNGRIGRLLIHAMLLRKNLPPAVIKQQKKRFYLAYLNQAQRGEGTGPLEELFCDAVIEGFGLIEKSL